jgi:hypothetical protein
MFRDLLFSRDAHDAFLLHYMQASQRAAVPSNPISNSPPLSPGRCSSQATLASRDRAEFVIKYTHDLALGVAIEVACRAAIVRPAYYDLVALLMWYVGRASATRYRIECHLDDPQPLQHCLDVYIWALIAAKQAQDALTINRLPTQSSPLCYTRMPSLFAIQLEQISSSAAIWPRPKGVLVHATRLGRREHRFFGSGAIMRAICSSAASGPKAARWPDLSETPQLP